MTISLAEPPGALKTITLGTGAALRAANQGASLGLRCRREPETQVKP